MSAARIEDIRQRLMQALDPEDLVIIDEGDRHIGHAGEGQGHFRVRIRSAAFDGKPLIQRHRMVNTVLVDLMGHGIHALAIEAKALNDG